MTGGGVFGRVISAARRAKTQKAPSTSARAADDLATDQSTPHLTQKPVEGLRVAEALLVLEESYNGGGDLRSCLEQPAWGQGMQRCSGSLYPQAEEPAPDDFLLIKSAPLGGVPLGADAQEAQLLRESDLDGSTSKGGPLFARRSDPLPRLGGVMEHVLGKTSKSTSGPLFSSGAPLPTSDPAQRPKAKSGPVLENQGSGRYAPGRLWKKETEKQSEPKRTTQQSSGAPGVGGTTAPTCSNLGAEAEALALWQAGPEDSAQIALSPPRRDCWNNVYHHTQSVGTMAFSPASENGSMRSQVSAEEVSSNQRPIEEAEVEQEEAAAAAAAAAAATVAAAGLALDVISPGPMLERSKEAKPDEQLPGDAPRVRKMGFSGPLCFQSGEASQVPASEQQGCMPLPEALPADIMATHPACGLPLGFHQLWGFGGPGPWGIPEDGLLLEGGGEVQEEVGEGEGPQFRCTDQECRDYKEWHDRQNQVKEQWAKMGGIAGSTGGAKCSPTGPCARSYSEELKGTMDEDRPEEVFLSGPLVKGSAPWASEGMECGTSQQHTGGDLLQQETVTQSNPMMPLEKSESGTRKAPRLSRFTEMEWDGPENVWEKPSPSERRNEAARSCQGAELGSSAPMGGGRFASGAYDPVHYETSPPRPMTEECNCGGSVAFPPSHRHSQPLQSSLGAVQMEQEVFPGSYSAPLKVTEQCLRASWGLDTQMQQHQAEEASFFSSRVTNEKGDSWDAQHVSGMQC